MTPDEGELYYDGPTGFRQIPDTLLFDLTLDALDVRLFGILTWHGRGNNGTYPGRKKLAEELGKKSLRTVDAALERLQAAGYLTITSRYGTDGGQMRNLYRLYFTPIGQEYRQFRERLGSRTPPADHPPVQSAAPGEGAADCTALRATDCEGPHAADCTPPCSRLHGKTEEIQKKKREEGEERDGAAGAAQRFAPPAPTTPGQGASTATSDEPGDGLFAPPAPAPKAKTRATSPPDELPVTFEMRTWARSNAITVNLEDETEQFLDFHRAKGSTLRDWTAGWRTWMRNTKKFGQPGGSRGMPGNHLPVSDLSDEANERNRRAFG